MCPYPQGVALGYCPAPRRSGAQNPSIRPHGVERFCRGERLLALLVRDLLLGPRSVMPTIPHQCHFERSEKSCPRALLYPGRCPGLLYDAPQERGSKPKNAPYGVEWFCKGERLLALLPRGFVPRYPVRHCPHTPINVISSEARNLALGIKISQSPPLTFVRGWLLRNDRPQRSRVWVWCAQPNRRHTPKAPGPSCRACPINVISSAARNLALGTKISQSPPLTFVRGWLLRNDRPQRPRVWV